MPQSNRLSSLGSMCAASLVFVRRFHKLSILLVDLAQQIVQLPRILFLYQALDNLPRLVKLSEQEIGHRQIVAVVIRSRD